MGGTRLADFLGKSGYDGFPSFILVPE